MRSKSYYIIYGGRSSEEFNLNIEHRVTKPTANNEYEFIKIPKGKTLYRSRGYKDIDIEIPFAFVTEPEEWERDFRNVKTWLNKKEEKILKFSDDLDVFYKVNTVSIDGESRSKKRIGRFNVVFTCEPYTYFDDGGLKMPLNRNGETLYNDYLESRPTYYINSNGNDGQIITLKVNDKETNIMVSDGLMIDTEKGLILTKNGNMSYVSLDGNFEDMYLQEGVNNISYSGANGSTIDIIPYWRCV